jgi:hypothetical protein
MTVLDQGERVRVVLSGRDYRDREIVRFAYSIPAPIGAVP